MSVVYYIPTDDDELLVSTMAGRGKARAVSRHGKVSLCVLDQHWPFAYLQVYADAVIAEDRDLVVDVMMVVAGRMSGEPLGEEARPLVEKMAAEERRAFFAAGPIPRSRSRHVTCTATTRTSRSPTGCRTPCPGTSRTPREGAAKPTTVVPHGQAVALPTDEVHAES